MIFIISYIYYHISYLILLAIIILNLISISIKTNMYLLKILCMILSVVVGIQMGSVLAKLFYLPLNFYVKPSPVHRYDILLLSAIIIMFRIFIILKRKIMFKNLLKNYKNNTMKLSRNIRNYIDLFNIVDEHIKMHQYEKAYQILEDNKCNYSDMSKDRIESKMESIKRKTEYNINKSQVCKYCGANIPINRVICPVCDKVIWPEFIYLYMNRKRTLILIISLLTIFLLESIYLGFVSGVVNFINIVAIYSMFYHPYEDRFAKNIWD